MHKKARSVLGFIQLVFDRFNEDRCLQVAGSLTFTSLLALVPLITIALVLISAFPVFSEFVIQLRTFILANVVPEAASKLLTVYMHEFTENAGRLTALGIAVLAVTALMTMLTIESAFNTIWRVRRTRPTLQRLLIFWTILTTGPILIGISISLTSWLVGLSAGLVGAASDIEYTVLKVVPVILTSTAFALLYATLPNRRVPPNDAVIGGIMAGLAFEVTKRGFAFYISNIASYTVVYGTFASVPIFLIWIYVSWLVVLFGAVVVAVLPYWRIGVYKVQRIPGIQFIYALQILNVLYDAHRQGALIKFRQICSQVRLGPENTEEILERLADAGWVTKVARNRWVMARDAAQIRVIDVYQLFVFQTNPELLADTEENRPVKHLLSNLSQRLSLDLDISLKELFTRQAEGELMISTDGQLKAAN